MAYQPNIPLASDRLKDSQADLQGNFQEVDLYLNVNHTAIDGTANQGKHKFVSMPLQVADPTTVANEICLFNKDDFSNNNQLFMRDPANGLVRQLTGFNANVTLPSTLSGYFSVGGGLYVKWFTDIFPIINPNVVNGPRTIAYPIGATIPAFVNNTYFAWFLPSGNTGGLTASINLSLTSSVNFSYFVRAQFAVAVNNVPITIMVLGS